MISSINHLEGIRVGYMPQDFREVLGTPDISALDFLKEQGMLEGSAQTYLSRMKFCKEEMHSDIGSLSGGQRGKLIILLMAIKKANFLILDEPTRNLSPLTAPVLRQELSDYPGAILVVSHDRLFLSKVCTRVLELTKAGLQPIEKESLYN
jgi:ATPase subunit of ABC transporter with duplicated ATPase domains